MENISRARAFSSPDLQPLQPRSPGRPDDHSLEGIATNVKLLLKLIQENNEASSRDIDDRKTQRIAGMITILDDVKTRIEKSQTAGRRRMAELRRCNTDLRPNRAPRDKKVQEPITDDKEKLKKQLTASLAARKSLEVMCSSLGKEKEIMACELARKVHEVSGMEELVNDLKKQNETLLFKLQACANGQERKWGSAGEAQGNAALQDRNKVLSEQLLKSLDSYKSLKRKYKEAKEESTGIRFGMEEIRGEIVDGLERIRSFRQRVAAGKDQELDIQEEISALEFMFERFNMKISKHEKQNVECSKAKAEINASKSPVVA